MEVKPGYKHTEVGVIPEQWKLVALESVARIIDPQPDHRTPPETAGGEPYIGISDFTDDDNVDWDSSRKIVSRAVDKQRLSFQVGPGNIIFGKIGTIGSPKFLPTVPFRFGLSANVLLIQPRIEPNFVMAWLRSKPCQRAVTGELHSTSQAAFGINKMRRVMIPLPTEAEQRAIATALSDVDGLLGGLDRLIAKKRDLKQAAMQQLLTCQTRLPGFHGEWEVRRLDDVADVIDPHPSHRAPVEVANGVPFLGIGDLDETGSIIGARLRFVDRSVLSEHAARYNLNDQLIGLGRVASIGKVVRLKPLPEGYAISPTLGIIRGRTAKRGYLLYALRSKFITEQFTRIMSGSTRSSVGMEVLRKLDVALPPSPEEQDAIAEVLAEMDAELAALEQRREKTRALKQAMMQELLTGRTRLV
jgi:type I restriction enzyme S subunit